MSSCSGGGVGKRLLLLLIGLAPLLTLFPAPSFAWWDSSWHYRKAITITTPKTETDYQLYINVTYDSDMQSDFDDVRFVDSDDATELSYYLDDKVDSTWATFYVKIPSLDNKTIYMYYGNPSASSKSNGDSVFEFFDDFSGSSLNSSKWETSTTGTVTVSNGILTWDVSSSSPPEYVKSKWNISRTSVVEFRMWTDNGYNSGGGGAGLGIYHYDGSSWPSSSIKIRDCSSTNSYECLTSTRKETGNRYLVQGSANGGNWMNVTMIWTANKVSIEAKWDDGTTDTLETEDTNYIPQEQSLEFSLREQDQPNRKWVIKLDWVRARKYIYPEPTVSFGSEEERGDTLIYIFQPKNETYYVSNITFVFKVTDSTNSSFRVKCYIDSVLEYDNSSYVNNTNITFYHTFSSEGLHNFTVWANGTVENSESRFFTIKAYELEGQSYSSVVYEATHQNFTIYFKYNPGLVDNITAELVWNSTGADASWHFSNSTHIWITAQKTIPLIQTNDTSIDFHWDYNVSYTNGTTISGSTSTETQSIYYAFFIGQLTSDKDKYIEGEDGTLYAYVKDLSGMADLYVNFTVYTENATPVKSIDYISSGGYTVFYFSANTGAATGNYDTRNFDAVLYINWVSGNQTAERWHSNESFTVYKVILTNCSAGSASTTKAFTMYLKDEETDADLDNGTIEISNTVWYDPSVKREYAFTFENVSNASICLYPTWATLNLESMVQYEKAPDYPDRTYFIKGTIDNVTDSVYLYLLESGLASNIIIYVKDTSGNPVEGAIVKIQRYYVGTNTYKTVAQVLTDFEGKGSTFLRVNEIYYKFVIEINGTVVRETQPTIIVCTSGSCPPYKITLTLEEEEISEWANTYGRISWVCSFNNLTGVFHCTASDTSQLVTKFRLRVDEIGLVAEENVCDTSEASSSVTLVCPLSGWQNKTYYYELSAYLPESGWVGLESDFLEFGRPSYSWGWIGLMAVFFLLWMSFFLSVGNPTLAFTLPVVVIVITSLMGIVPLHIEALISLIVVAGVIIYLMRV